RSQLGHRRGTSGGARLSSARAADTPINPRKGGPSHALRPSRVRLESVRCMLPRVEADMPRRDFLKVLAVAAAVWPVAAQAQTYPSRPIAIVGPFAEIGRAHV